MAMLSTYQADQFGHQLDGSFLNMLPKQGMTTEQPLAANSHSTHLEEDVRNMLERVATPGGNSRGLNAKQLAVFISHIFPSARGNELHAAAALSLWVLLWDNRQGERHQREARMEYDDFTSLEKPILHPDESEQIPLVRSGEHDATSYTVDARGQSCMFLLRNSHATLDRYSTREQQKIRYTIVKDYMGSRLTEMRMGEANILPDAEWCLKLRIRASGIYPMITVLESVAGVRLPITVMQSLDMKALWREMAIICAFIADLYMIGRDKVPSNEADSVIAAISATGKRSPSADSTRTREDTLAMIRGSMSLFDKAARGLGKVARSLESHVVIDVESYVKTCRLFVGGLLSWLATVE